MNVRNPLSLLAVPLLGAALVSATASAAPPDSIRSGGPSAPADSKVAVVLSKSSLVGRSFSVRNAAGKTVLRGKLRKAPGTPAPWKRGATANLSSITTPGSYKVVVGRLTSRAWTVRARPTDAPLLKALRFFAVNSDGNEPSPAHGPSHLNDATIIDGPAAGQKVDLTGGWMDAGDMLKFTFTTDFTVSALELAARLDPTNAAAIRATSEVGVRWLLKAHPAPGVFVMEVGDIEADHERAPEVGADPAKDDTSSIAKLANRRARTGIGTDYGGATAAALALVAQRETDPARKATLIAEAKAWYDAGEATDKLAPRLPEDPYESSAGVDDMAFGAVELYRATGDVQYITDSIDWLKGANVDGDPSWDGVGALAAAELCGAMGLPAPSDAAAAAGCPALAKAGEAALDRARTFAAGTPGSIGFGTTAANGGSGAILAFAGRNGLKGGQAGAAAARDWLFGRNNWGASFLAGFGPRSARHPHHWATAKGGQAAVAGAVVGGPTERSILVNQKLKVPKGAFDSTKYLYEDRITDYVTSEPALDYTSSNILLLAALAG